MGMQTDFLILLLLFHLLVFLLLLFIFLLLPASPPRLRFGLVLAMVVS